MRISSMMRPGRRLITSTRSDSVTASSRSCVISSAVLPARLSVCASSRCSHVRVWTLHALAVDEGRTLARRVKTRADVEQCRLAAAARADEGDNFAIANGEAHPLHRRERFPGSCRETHAHVAVFEPYQVRHGPNSSRQQRLVRALVLQNDTMAYSGGRQNMAGERHAPRERVRWPHVR